MAVRRGVGSVFVGGGWGCGQLGLGDTDNRQVRIRAPTVVPALRGVSLVTAGSGSLYSFSLGMNGTVMVWGHNGSG